jgi:CubicO group peptidase (beta-lactamase class C family)
MFTRFFCFRVVVTCLVCFSLLLVLISCGDGSSGKSDKEYLSYSLIRDMGQEALETDRQAAISIALMSDGYMLWSQEFGYADHSAQTPVTRETRFGIGSVSKVFTAAAIMKLADQGLVRLDDPVTQYLPDFEMLSLEYRDITVRMLINHSSGFPGSNYRGGMSDRPWPEYQDSVYQSVRQSRLKHSPGYMNVYCNDGFTLAELIVQVAAGMPFTRFVHEELLEPLGMTRSGYATDLLPEGSYAVPHYEGNDLPMEVLNFYGAGGIFSTPEDLVRFLSMVSTRGLAEGTRLISESSVKAMEENQTSGTFRLVDTDFLAFGLGWDNVSHPAAKYVGKTALTKDGGTLFYRAELWVIPKENIGVAVVAVNAPGADLAGMAEKAVLAAMADKGVLEHMPEPISRPDSPEADPPGSLLTSIAGYYANYQTLYRISIQPQNRIQIDIRDENEWNPELVDMSFRENGWFASEDDPGLEIRFTEDQGRLYMVLRQQADYFDVELPLAQRLIAGSPLSSAWSGRLNKSWLKANDIAASYFHYMDFSPRLDLIAVEDLPGHVFWGDSDDYLPGSTGNGDETAHMNILIPIAEGRDLSDLEIVNRDGEEWLISAGFLYRPLEGVAALDYGQTRTFLIQEENLTEWIRLEQAGIEATMVINGPQDSRWVVWDAQFNLAGQGWGPASIVLNDDKGPYYAALYAEPGQTVKLSWH